LDRLEGTIAFAEQESPPASRQCQIEDTVVVEVRNRYGHSTDRVALRWLKGAVALAEKDVQPNAAQGRQVRDAIAVEVPHGHVLSGAKRIVLRGVKRTIALTEEDTDSIDKVLGLTREHQIEITITVQIT